MAGKRKRCPCVLCHNARLQPGAKRGKRLDADVVAEHVDAWGLPTEYDADSDYLSFSDAGSDDNSTGSPDAAPAAAADEDDAPQASPQAPAPSQPLSPSAQANDAPHMLPPAVGGPRGLCDAFLADRNRRLAAADVTYNECGGNVRDVCLGVLHNMVSSKGTYAQLLRELNGHRKYRGAHALPETIDEVIGIVLPEWPRRADFDCCQRCGRTAFVDADWAPLPPKQHANCSVSSCFAERHQLRGRGDGVFVLAKPAFHTVDIAMQLWILFSRPDISAMLNTVAPRSGGLITSIQDGALWQQVVALKRSANAGELVCAWALFVDGISPFGMSWTSYSSTPIMLECLDLPAAMRRKPENLILAAVTKGPTKIKDLQVVFRELAQRMSSAAVAGDESCPSTHVGGKPALAAMRAAYADSKSARIFARSAASITSLRPSSSARAALSPAASVPATAVDMVQPFTADRRRGCTLDGRTSWPAGARAAARPPRARRSEGACVRARARGAHARGCVGPSRRQSAAPALPSR